MTRLALWLLFGACSTSATGEPAYFDAPIDIGGLCGPIADAGAEPFLRTDFTACGCCADNETACVDVTVDAMGNVVSVMAAANQPPSIDVLACLQGRVTGRCEANLAGRTMQFCATGP